MKVIRENSSFILGYFAYYAYSTALNALLLLGMSFLMLRYFSRPSGFVYLLLWIGVKALAGYLSFLASIRWIALPVLKRTKNIPEKNGQELLIIEWFLFSLFIYLYGNLAASVLLSLFHTTKEIQNGITFIWIVIVSFFLYKDTVSSYAFSSTEQKSVSENDSQPKVV